MTRDEFLRALEGELALDSGCLKENQTLKSVKGWDSMAAVQFIALADEQVGVALSGDQIAKSRTISELLSLLGDRLTV
jgi:acyl carrier protein